MGAEKKKRSILSLNSSRNGSRTSQSISSILCCSFVQKKKTQEGRRVNPTQTYESKIKADSNKVHALQLCPCSHIISVQFWMCHCRSETLRALSCGPASSTRSAISATFPSLFLPLVSHWSRSASVPRSVSEREPQARAGGGTHGVMFTAFHSRKAESLGTQLVCVCFLPPP